MGFMSRLRMRSCGNVSAYRRAGGPRPYPLELHRQLFRVSRGRVPRPVCAWSCAGMSVRPAGQGNPGRTRWNYIGSHLGSVGDGFPVPFAHGVVRECRCLLPGGGTPPLRR